MRTETIIKQRAKSTLLWTVWFVLSNEAVSQASAVIYGIYSAVSGCGINCDVQCCRSVAVVC